MFMQKTQLKGEQCMATSPRIRADDPIYSTNIEHTEGVLTTFSRSYSYALRADQFVLFLEYVL